MISLRTYLLRKLTTEQILVVQQKLAIPLLLSNNDEFMKHLYENKDYKKFCQEERSNEAKKVYQKIMMLTNTAQNPDEIRRIQNNFSKTIHDSENQFPLLFMKYFIAKHFKTLNVDWSINDTENDLNVEPPLGTFESKPSADEVKIIEIPEENKVHEGHKEIISNEPITDDDDIEILEVIDGKVHEGPKFQENEPQALPSNDVEKEIIDENDKNASVHEKNNQNILNKTNPDNIVTKVIQKVMANDVQINILEVVDRRVHEGRENESKVSQISTDDTEMKMIEGKDTTGPKSKESESNFVEMNIISNEGENLIHKCHVCFDGFEDQHLLELHIFMCHTSENNEIFSKQNLLENSVKEKEINNTDKLLDENSMEKEITSEENESIVQVQDIQPSINEDISEERRSETLEMETQTSIGQGLHDEISIESDLTFRNVSNSRNSQLKGHKCKSCGKSFSRVDHLKRHIKTVHEGHKDHKCESCSKSVSQE